MFSYRSFRAQQPTRTVFPVLLIQTFLAFYSLRSTRFLQVIRKSFLLSFLCAIRNKLFIKGQHRHISDKRQKSTVTVVSNSKNENNSGWRSLSKVIWDCIGFALLLCDWSSKNSRHSLNQSDSNRKIVTTWLPVFSRALGSLLVFTLGSHWLDRVFSFLLIGRRDNFGFVFYDT